MGMGGVSLLPLGLAKVFQGGGGSLSWRSGRSKTAPCGRLPRWVSRSFWATWLSDYLQAHLTDLVGQLYPWVWIWDPGDLVLGLLLNCAIFIPLGVLLLLAGRLFIPKFYKKSQYNYIVSTTIECLGEQCSLCWDESSIDWSADPLHAQIADSDGWIYKSQGRDNSFVVGNYLEEAGDLPSVYARFELQRGQDRHCHGSIWFASEMKAISDACERFISFPPGHLYSSKQGGLRRWYNPQWFLEKIPSTPYDPIVLREAFEKAVLKRLMTDVPFGVLLSGGLDSSLVAAVACRYLAKSEAARQWGSQLHTFCLNLQGSPDLKAAREVADYLGTHHHEFHFTVQEGIDALEEVIYHIETYDVTTIRASIPMFLMSRKIKSLGVKMVLSGEGSDEIFGGYLYFHKAPNKEEFHQETYQKIKALHLYNCLRATKSTSAWGVEAHVPFLDKEFIKTAMNIDPEWKMIRPDLGRIDKWVLRKAFDDDQKPYLPKAEGAI
ncbi:asparagine synthetase [glutamine-hydrolyzing] 2-like [Rosa rugosa]|uniref:asparagine synthetase [glutamine-hydrolyzing] 2-like n=1 Tax=Rosa rugosa TaxID=74645 RepID=UPI002B407081|nr:asparagine synthetase [glutamine-hydrolyzing] 2-like [Rosa rugosa]